MNMTKCPQCGGMVEKAIVTRRYDAPGGPIDYEAPVERCLSCKETFSGPAAAAAELRAIKAHPELCPWDDSLQRMWDRYIDKKGRREQEEQGASASG